MIKLLRLIELEKPKNVYSSNYNTAEEPNDDFMQKGFKLKQTTIEPETGKASSEVEYLPGFGEDRRTLLMMRKSFQPHKFSSNPEIATLARNINTSLTKLSNAMFALEKMIELQRKSK